MSMNDDWLQREIKAIEQTLRLYEKNGTLSFDRAWIKLKEQAVTLGNIEIIKQVDILYGLKGTDRQMANTRDWVGLLTEATDILKLLQNSNITDFDNRMKSFSNSIQSTAMNVKLLDSDTHWTATHICSLNAMSDMVSMIKMTVVLPPLLPFIVMDSLADNAISKYFTTLMQAANQVAHSVGPIHSAIRQIERTHQSLKENFYLLTAGSQQAIAKEKIETKNNVQQAFSHFKNELKKHNPEDVSNTENNSLRNNKK